MVRIKRLVDPSTSHSCWVWYNDGDLQHPLMLLDAQEMDRIAQQFYRDVEEINKGGKDG